METVMETRPSIDQLEPTGDWVIVRPLEVADVSEGGIMMPVNATSNLDRYGEVVAVGDGFWQAGVRVKPSVDPGQIVMYREGRGIEMRFKGEKIFFMTERDFFARIKG